MTDLENKLLRNIAENEYAPGNGEPPATYADTGAVWSSCLMAPGYLDSGGFGDHAQPFRWCHLADFFPAQVFTDMRAMVERQREHSLENITAYERLR